MYNIDTSTLRQKNPENPWLFPVRMENSSRIEWKENIVEALACFKAPITESTWLHCLRRKLIAAETPEEQKKLEEWWSIGWKETPQLPNGETKPNPIMRVRQNALGETLEKIYPSNTIARQDLKCNKKQLAQLCEGIEMAFARGIQLRPMRKKETNYMGAVDDFKWTLFAPDNTILMRAKTLKEIAAKMNISYSSAHYACKARNGVLASGNWFWNDEHGLVPTAPNGEVLPDDWREKNLPKNRG